MVTAVTRRSRKHRDRASDHGPIAGKTGGPQPVADDRHGSLESLRPRPGHGPRPRPTTGAEPTTCRTTPRPPTTCDRLRRPRDRRRCQRPVHVEPTTARRSKPRDRARQFVHLAIARPRSPAAPGDRRASRSPPGDPALPAKPRGAAAPRRGQRVDRRDGADGCRGAGRWTSRSRRVALRSERRPALEQVADHGRARQRLAGESLRTGTVPAGADVAVPADHGELGPSPRYTGCPRQLRHAERQAWNANVPAASSTTLTWAGVAAPAARTRGTSKRNTAVRRAGSHDARWIRRAASRRRARRCGRTRGS